MADKSKVERKISSKVTFKESKEEYYTSGYIATTEVDTENDKIDVETLYVWRDDINSTEDLDANPTSLHHERDDTTLVGLGDKTAKVEKMEDGVTYGLWVDTHHNKTHKDFENTKYQLENDFLTHYSIEYDTNDNRTTWTEEVDGKSIRILGPETTLKGYGLASPRTVVNKGAEIIEAGYKELINMKALHTHNPLNKKKSKLKKTTEVPKMTKETKEEPKPEEDKPDTPKPTGEETETKPETEPLSEAEAKEVSEFKEFKEKKIAADRAILAELKETKAIPPLNKVGEKIEGKETIETKEQNEFKEIHLEFKERVLGYGKEKSKDSSKEINTGEHFLIADRLVRQLKEHNVAITRSEGMDPAFSLPFEIKENKIEVKTDVRVESDPAGTTTSNYPAILANYEQSPSRLNDIYGPAIINHLNEQRVTWNILRKENGSGMSAIRIRARTTRNTVDISSGYGATPSFTTQVGIKKFNLTFVTNFVPVQLEDEVIAFARSPGGIGDAFGVEVQFSTEDLMKRLNRDQIYGTGDGTSEAVSLGLDGGLIRTSGNLYGKDVTASGFTTLAAAGRDTVSSVKITLKRMRDMYRASIVNGARIQNLAFTCSWLQYHFIYALIQDLQRTVPTSAKVGFTGLAELDGIPIFPDPDLDEKGMTDDLFLLDIVLTKISINVPPTFVEFGKVSLHRRGVIWIVWNLFSDAPNHNYQTNGLVTS